MTTSLLLPRRTAAWTWATEAVARGTGSTKLNTSSMGTCTQQRMLVKTRLAAAGHLQGQLLSDATHAAECQRMTAACLSVQNGGTTEGSQKRNLDGTFARDPDSNERPLHQWACAKGRVVQLFSETRLSMSLCSASKAITRAARLSSSVLTPDPFCKQLSVGCKAQTRSHRRLVPSPCAG